MDHIPASGLLHRLRMHSIDMCAMRSQLPCMPHVHSTVLAPFPDRSACNWLTTNQQNHPAAIISTALQSSTVGGGDGWLSEGGSDTTQLKFSHLTCHNIF